MTTRSRANLLGSYLRARRELVTPEQAGLRSHGVRRTPGLRREEVALLAGISADYYLRLERGRDTRPSVQVLESIARVLRLDDVHVAYLMSIACEAPRAVRRPVAEVPEATVKLMEALGQPAFVEDRFYDIRAANGLARALSPGLVAGANQLRDLLLSPAAQAQHPDWREIAVCWVACLRQAVGPDVDDPQVVALVDELSASARFRQLWARHDVRVQDSGSVRVVHREVGELRLNRDRLAISGAPDLHLVVLHPDAGSADAERLAGVLADPRLSGALAGV